MTTVIFKIGLKIIMHSYTKSLSPSFVWAAAICDSSFSIKSGLFASVPAIL